MINQEEFFKKEDLKTPSVLVFSAIYIFAVVLVFFNEPENALPYIGLSIGILFLCWLIIDLTKKMKVQDIEIKRPGLELIVGLLILIIWDYLPLPKIDFGDKWNIGLIIKKTILFVGLPFLFLKFQKNSPASMGLTSKDWKKIFGSVLLFFWHWLFRMLFWLVIQAVKFLAESIVLRRLESDYLHHLFIIS